MRVRRTFGPIALVAALALSMTGAASATPGGQVERDDPAPWEREDRPSSGGFIDGRWFVELSAEPEARGGGPAAHANERAQLQAEARTAGATFTERSSFTQLWNGLTVEADETDAARLQQLDSVEAVYPVAEIERPDPADAAPELGSALEMTGASAAQSELGLTGKGLSVAIIDTGIDYNHPDLGGDGEKGRSFTAGSADDRRLTDDEGDPHARVTYGYDYVGDDFNPADPDAPQDPDPNPDPMDPQGHGTHVAGITGADAAEDDGVTGVAPKVDLGAYKVFGPGSTTSEVIVQALEDAYEDGMDIVNMSLGAAFAWGQDYPTTAMSNELTAQGVTVINSAGNSGGDGTWSLSAPANAHDVISVASADNTEMLANSFEVDELGTVPWQILSGAAAPPEEGTSDPVVAAPEDEDGRLGCDAEAFETDHFEDATALIERGECPFAEKYLNAVGAGATGVVIYNNVPGLFAGTIEDAGVEGAWGVGISDADGQALVAELDDSDEEITLGFTDEQVQVASPTGGLVSAFSSYGQDVELEFGPSVMAPGGLITSTYPLELEGYAMLSGTSMAAPHVAGAVALLLDSEPDLDPLEVRDRLQNTAEPAVWSLNPDAGLLDHTFRQGAGMIQIDRTIEAEHSITPAQLAVGDDSATTTTFTVTNDSDDEATYTVGHAPTLTTAVSTYAPSFFLTPDEIVDAPEEVTVPAEGSTELEVTITAPGLELPNHQYGGYLTFTADGEEDPQLRVPYAGYDGDYADEMGLLGFWNQVLDGEGNLTGAEFIEQPPELAEIVGTDEDGEPILEPVEEGHTFTVRDGDEPVVDAFFGHFPRQMQVYAVDEDDERRLVLDEEYLPRSPWADETWAFPWDGTTAAGQSDNSRPLASGTYTLEVEVLRALGDPDNEDHWDTWTSPEFELDSRRGQPGGPDERPGRGPGSSGPGNTGQGNTGQGNGG